MNSIARLYYTASSYINSLYQYILFQITGKTQLHRLCARAHPSNDDRLLVQVHYIIVHTKRYASVYMQLQSYVDDLPANPSTVHSNDKTVQLIDDTVRQLCTIDCISNKSDSSAASTLRYCIRNIVLLYQLQYNTVPQLASISYDSSNQHHEKQLYNIYNRLTQQHITDAIRYSDVWSHIGFQGTNPATGMCLYNLTTYNRNVVLYHLISSSYNVLTDFRSTGLYGLYQLHEYCTHCTESQSICHQFIQAGHMYYFSFAITGINITGDIMWLLQHNYLNQLLFRYGINLITLNILYACMYSQFNQLWIESKPSNVMEFGSIHQRFIEELKLKLLNNTYSLDPHIVELYTNNVK